MELELNIEMSTIYMDLWCTGPHIEGCLPEMITHADLSFSQEVSSSVVKSMVRTGPAIIPQQLESFKDQSTPSFQQVCQACSSVDPIFQAIWAYLLMSFLYSFISLACGIHSSGHIVISAAQNVNPGSNHNKFKMLSDRQCSSDIVSFTIYTRHSNRQANTEFQLWDQCLLIFQLMSLCST